MKDSDDLSSVEKYLSELDCAQYWSEVKPVLTGSGVLKSIRRNVLLANIAAGAPADFADISVEVVSDLSSAATLAIIGAYKPSMMTLRSAVENSVRVLLRQAGVVTWNSFDVKEMFKQGRTEAHGIDKKAGQLVDEARELYKRLCAFVHTGGRDQMTLEGRLRHIPRFDKSKLELALSEIKIASKFTTNTLFLAHATAVRNAHPESRDFILDGVVKRLKANR